MNISKILDLDNFQRMIDAGYISKRKHPSMDLYVANYTHNCQYDKVWNSETEQSRGLLFDGSGEIIARPFRKFYNYEEDFPKGKIPNESFDAFKKADGSLGILYLDHDLEFSLATRGSFESDQAKEGTKIFREKYGLWMLQNRKFFKNKTVLFEIIYPENRIVIDYKGLRDTIMLAIIDNDTGKDVSVDIEFPWSVVEKYDGLKDLKAIKQLNSDNEEGFVIIFESGYRCKVKFDEYMRLHRILTGINEKDIWEALKLGKGVHALVDKVPDEFYVWIKKTEAKLTAKFDEINKEVLDFVNDTKSRNFVSRKDLAIHIQKNAKPELRGSIFSAMDNKPYTDNVWELFKPKGPFHSFKIDEE